MSTSQVLGMDELVGRRGDTEMGADMNFDPSYFRLGIEPLCCLRSDGKLLLSWKPKEKGSQVPKAHSSACPGERRWGDTKTTNSIFSGDLHLHPAKGPSSQTGK